MRDRAGHFVLPRYNNAAPATGVISSPRYSPRSEIGGPGADTRDSILVDIEGGDLVTGGGATPNKSRQSWWRTDVITSPIKTAVFTHLGSAVSSGWSRARGVLLTSSISSYMRRVPTLEKPFDLNEIHQAGDPNDI